MCPRCKRLVVQSGGWFLSRRRGSERRRSVKYSRKVVFFSCVSNSDNQRRAKKKQGWEETTEIRCPLLCRFALPKAVFVEKENDCDLYCCSASTSGRFLWWRAKRWLCVGIESLCSEKWKVCSRVVRVLVRVSLGSACRLWVWCH